jgi:hypothetical protein
MSITLIIKELDDLLEGVKDLFPLTTLLVIAGKPNL